MAQRRMLSIKIIDTDLFLDMPISTRLLYYDLCLRADDDGFVSSPKKIMKLIGVNDDDFKILLAKKYIIPFESGICVIKHWKIHNYIQSDRYTQTEYKQELSAITLVDNKYEILDTKCIQDVSKADTQDRIEIGENRLEIGKVKLGSWIQKRIKEYAEEDIPLQEALNQFVEHRKTMKKTIKTQYTLNLLLTELDKHSDKLAVVNQSIANGWQGLFEVKKNSSRKSNNQFYELGKDEGIWS